MSTELDIDDGISDEARAKLPRTLLDVACRIRCQETLHKDDELVDAAAHNIIALRKALATSTAELALRSTSGSASDRLHNLCEGIAKDADGSEWSREEWESLDAEMLELKKDNKRLTAERDALREDAERLHALLKCVPLPPKAITYEHGWELLDKLQALAIDDAARKDAQL